MEFAGSDRSAAIFDQAKVARKNGVFNICLDMTNGPARTQVLPGENTASSSICTEPWWPGADARPADGTVVAVLRRGRLVEAEHQGVRPDRVTIPQIDAQETRPVVAP